MLLQMGPLLHLGPVITLVPSTTLFQIFANYVSQIVFTRVTRFSLRYESACDS